MLRCREVTQSAIRSRKSLPGASRRPGKFTASNRRGLPRYRLCRKRGERACRGDQGTQGPTGRREAAFRSAAVASHRESQMTIFSSLLGTCAVLGLLGLLLEKILPAWPQRATLNPVVRASKESSMVAGAHLRWLGSHAKGDPKSNIDTTQGLRAGFFRETRVFFVRLSSATPTGRRLRQRSDVTVMRRPHH